VKRTSHITTYNGKPIIVNDNPITVAQIPVNGEALHQSVLLHPRYAKDIDHRLIEIYGFVRGRGIDVVEYAPVGGGHDGKRKSVADELRENGLPAYNVLNFKGTGADADEPLSMHPTHWWINGEWIKRRSGGFSEMRMWGGVWYSWAEDEFKNDMLRSSGIPTVEHLSIHRVPGKIVDTIFHGSRHKRRDLTQIVRAYNTNIRIRDCVGPTPAIMPKQVRQYIHPKDLVVGDSSLVLRQIHLAESGKELYCNGDVDDNRLIDGLFLDMENYEVGVIRDTQGNPGLKAIQSVVFAMNNSMALLSKHHFPEYLALLQERTGWPIAECRNNIPKTLREHFEREYRAAMSKSQHLK
jgi:hypothetical protein